MQCIEGWLLYIPKYEIEAASGRLCRYQSMQEKLPVASSLYRVRSILMCGNSGKNVFYM